MRVLVVYDTFYGNTEKIARGIGSAIVGEVRVVRAGEVDASGLESVDLLIVGSPTQGGRPTQPIQDFIAKIPESVAKGVRMAAFDTRYTGRFVKLFGFAGERIADSLVAKGGTLVSPAEAFFVTGKMGPIKEGELERAASWARGIAR